MFATGVTVGLAEWIIDDTCLVHFVAIRLQLIWKHSCIYILTHQAPTAE